MADTGHTIQIELVEARGTCVAGHKVGDTFRVPGGTPRFSCDGLCIHALYSMLPKIFAMRYGARFSWEKDVREPLTHACPDAGNPHTFELRPVAD